MRKILMLAMFVMMAGFASAQAKTCTKPCTAAQKAACAKKGIICTSTKAGAATDAASSIVNENSESVQNVLSASAQAELAASKDENIQRKECAMSGNVSYFQKSVCSKSGKVSMNEVKYCTKSNAFVNASPSEVMNEAQAKAIKTADTVDGEVQTAKKGAKKKCCAGKKKCSSKKGA